MVNDKFTQLLTKKLTHELTSEEREEFSYLLEESEFNKQQHKFFKDYWEQDQEEYSNSDRMFQHIKSKITLPAEEVTDTTPSAPRVTRLGWFIRSIAAILVIGLATGALYYFGQDDLTRENELELTKTPSRVKSKITLSDGSVVTLNSESVLKYPPVFIGKTREVYLNGEAFFNVKKDPHHPFIVHAGNLSIRVLGTTFNVRSYDNDVASETTLIKGAIEVTLKDRPSDRIILKPNEKLVLKSTPSVTARKAKALVAVRADNINTSYALTRLTYLKSNDTTVIETSWVNNQLIFQDEDFKAIANKMKRWYGLPIEFKNDKVKKYHFTGVFERESVNQALHALQMIEPFDYNIQNGTIYIY